MPDPYIGEIRMWAGTFAPVGWHLCDGTLLEIAENQVLFSLLGDYYGGDGSNTFGLPDLRGRVPINFGHGPGLTDYDQVGLKTGQEENALLVSNLPPVAIGIPAYVGNATHDTPSPQLCLAKSNSSTAPSHSIEIYSDQTPNTAIRGGTLPGSSDPFDIRQPSLSVCFIISLYGVYPLRS